MRSTIRKLILGAQPTNCAHVQPDTCRRTCQQYLKRSTHHKAKFHREERGYIALLHAPLVRCSSQTRGKTSCANISAKGRSRKFSSKTHRTTLYTAQPNPSRGTARTPPLLRLVQILASASPMNKKCVHGQAPPTKRDHHMYTHER